MGYKHVPIEISGETVEGWLSIDDIDEVQEFAGKSGKEIHFMKYVLWLALRKTRKDLDFSDMGEVVGELPGEYLQDKTEYLTGIVQQMIGSDRQIPDDAPKKSGPKSTSSSSGGVSEYPGRKSGATRRTK